MWVVNYGNDLIVILINFGEFNLEVLVKSDVYVEYFLVKLIGIVFGYDDMFVVLNDLINELWGMNFIKNFEWNKNFVNNYFMGFILFLVSIYVLVG